LNLNEESLFKSSFYGGISNFYLIQNKFLESLKYADLCEKILDSLKIESPYQYLIPYNNKVGSFRFLNDTKNYATYLDKLFTLRERIITKDNSTQYSINQYQQSLLQKEFEKKIIENQLKQNKRILILSSLLLLSVIIFLYFTIRQRNELKISNKTIQSLLQSREKFYSILAHDIRSPMKSYQGIASKISFLLKKGMYDEIKELSEKIDSTGNHLDNLFQNLIDWSKLQQNSFTNTNHIFKPHQILEDILKIHEIILQENKTIIIIESDEDITINQDKNYFSIVVRNILDNAIKNLNKDQHLKIASQIKDQQYSFCVKNSTDIKEHDFIQIQQFFNSSIVAHPGQHGFGLGLVLIKEFTEKMGGKISVEKKDNHIQFCMFLNLSTNDLP